jgi:hypothetical protein
MSPRARAALRTVTMAFTVAAFAGTAPSVSAQMFVPTGRDTLRGLPGVEVVVEELQPEIAREGLSRASIQSDVVAQLKAAGIRVYPSQMANASQAKAYLYVHVNALTLPRQAGYALAVQVHLRQTLVSRVTGSNVVNAMTWDAHNVLGVPDSDLRLVRREIRSFVSQFVEDWTAVH